MQYTGTVIRQPFGTGTKSQHLAVLLDTGAEAFRLRRAEGNPFHDPVLDELVGHRIVCEGRVHNGTLIVESLNSVDE